MNFSKKESFLTPMIKAVKKLFILWTELWSIPVALLIWFKSDVILRWADPTAGTYDAGILQCLLFGVIALLLGNGIAFLGIKFNFPSLFKFYENEAGENFNQLEPWQKIKTLLALYLGLLFAFALLARPL